MGALKVLVKSGDGHSRVVVFVQEEESESGEVLGCLRRLFREQSLQEFRGRHANMPNRSRGSWALCSVELH